MNLKRHILLGLLLIFSSTTVSTAAEPIVDFELATAPGFPLTGARKWIDFVKECGVIRIRIRGARATDEASVKNIGTTARPIYHVTGVISADNKLYLEGGVFRLGQKAPLTAWVRKLKLDGIEALTTQTSAFGLTDQQLLKLHAQLSRKVTFTTLGLNSGDAVRQVARQLELRVTLVGDARASLDSKQEVLDELQGLSSGTALAALLRPLGLALVPNRPQGGELRLLLMPIADAEESWPIGWPPEKAPGNIAPKLFKFLNVEIRDIMLSDALAALHPRLEMPMLMDHNSLVRFRVDPTKVKVAIPAGKTFYKKILDHLLSQAGMSAEIRVDEQETPFLWLTTAKKR